MRITLVAPGFNLSGGIRVLAIYAERLRRRGHQLLVVAPQPDPPPTLWQCFKSFVKGKGWPRRTRDEHSHFDGLPIERRLLDHPGRLVAADVPDADVIIGTWWETACWVADLPAAKGLKVHFVQGYETYASPVEQVDAAYALPTVKVVVSNWLHDLMEKRFQQTPAAVVPNSVDTAEFFAPARGKQAVPTVGMLYHTLPLKGCDVGVKAYEEAARALPGLKLVTIGEMAVDPSVPLPPTAEFLRQARGQALRDAYSRCDAWLFPSREEGFGLPILEAMACRTPVIAAPAGAAPELLAKGGGILVPREDPKAMAEAIVNVCSRSDAEWRALSDAALATAKGYTWDDGAELLEKTLLKLVEQSRSVPKT
jgi:glycosyltransferase involved in cell wall biosynthesis